MLTKLVLLLSFVLYLVGTDTIQTESSTLTLTLTLTTISATTKPSALTSKSESESESESESDDDGIDVGQYCPIVFDESMTECQKIQAILSVLESKKGGKDFCEEPKVWLDQLKLCCTTRYGMPDRPCVRNIEKVFDTNVEPLLNFGDVQ